MHKKKIKMSNVGRRKCKYFGATSFRFSFFFFLSQDLLSFSAPSSLSRQRACRCRFSALTSASGTFPSHTRRPTVSKRII